MYTLNAMERFVTREYPDPHIFRHIEYQFDCAFDESDTKEEFIEEFYQDGPQGTGHTDYDLLILLTLLYKESTYQKGFLDIEELKSKIGVQKEDTYPFASDEDMSYLTEELKDWSRKRERDLTPDIFEGLNIYADWRAFTNV